MRSPKILVKASRCVKEGSNIFSEGGQEKKLFLQ